MSRVHIPKLPISIFVDVKPVTSNLTDINPEKLLAWEKYSKQAKGLLDQLNKDLASYDEITRNKALSVTLQGQYNQNQTLAYLVARFANKNFFNDHQAEVDFIDRCEKRLQLCSQLAEQCRNVLKVKHKGIFFCYNVSTNVYSEFSDGVQTASKEHIGSVRPSTPRPNEGSDSVLADLPANCVPPVIPILK